MKLNERFGLMIGGYVLGMGLTLIASTCTPDSSSPDRKFATMMAVWVVGAVLIAVAAYRDDRSDR